MVKPKVIAELLNNRVSYASDELSSRIDKLMFNNANSQITITEDELLPEKPIIMIVDDEVGNRQLLLKTLAEEYHCVEAKDGIECLEKLTINLSPAAFLLDIDMPHKNGIELCKEIRSESRFKTTPILFLTALDQNEHQVNGFQAGCDDFISKPINLESLSLKLESLILRDLGTKEQLTQATEIAQTAMQNCGELGIVNQFLEGLRDCKQYGDLANHLVKYCHNFSVSAAVALYTEDGVVTNSISSSANELEIELMNRGRQAPRILTLGNRCLFNFKDCALLIRAMPADSDKAGRYRDHFASLLSGVETRMSSLKAEHALKTYQREIIQGALVEIREGLNTILRQYKYHDDSTRKILDDFVEELQVTFSYIDLTDEQEEKLNAIVFKSIENITSIYKEGLEIDRGFSSIVRALENIA